MMSFERWKFWYFPLLVASLSAAAFAQLPFSSTEGSPDDPRLFVNCTVLRWERQAFLFPKIFVSEPGKYCLDRDYTADMRSCLRGGCLGNFIEIRASDVEIDLRGHTLRVVSRADGLGYGGIQTLGDKISVRNGRLVNSGILMGAPGGPSITDFPRKLPPRYFDGYSAGGFTIEDIVIEGGGLLILGQNATVRRSRFIGVPFRAPMHTGPIAESQYLDSQPQFIVGIYGPSPTVEDNVIEQQTRTAGRAVAYSIVLRDATDAIVRSNVVRNKGDRKSTVALGLKDSKNAVVMNNQFIDIETPVLSIGSGSTFTLTPPR